MKTNLSGERWITSGEKRAFDIAAALALMPVALPAGALTLALCRAVDGPEALFIQKRLGKRDSLIPVCKIRTMRPAHPEEGERSHVTGIGRLVRPLALDETPQLFNVLLGHMSITGPRAYETARVDHMEAVLPKDIFEEWQEVTSPCRPGGISSYGIMTRSDIAPHEKTFKAKALLDIKDGRNASFSHDLELLQRAAAMGISVIRRQLIRPEAVPETAPGNIFATEVEIPVSLTAGSAVNT